MNERRPLGFPYPATSPMQFLVDDEIRPFEIDIRHDLTGTGLEACPILSSGVYIVHEHVVPDNTAEVVLNVYPHCWARTNIGDPDESVQQLDPLQTAGFVLFDVTRDNGQPTLVENNYNKPTLAASPNDRDRDSVRGKTFTSPHAPLLQLAGLQTPLGALYYPARSTFRVIFRLAPVAPANAVDGYIIGSPTAPPDAKRIDFAGALVTGVRMPQQTYDQLKTARRKGLLGVEAY